ncbi:hypothetical protein LOC68_16380 [Blastopirellula sp. JC732]|uniref:Uncharacterized protein n=1 Tax=Blastopirellula sediminis TaxID=2894196 RepID=A0A9X1MPH2_9BACT|nr:hypothetical protein [Blastopirellula sediminis]MCC9606733.1 hypothetical protein [Blastopirellula sediminis]MCC9629970.1 hypothetical protein [Blastopirellula sediminis]
MGRFIGFAILAIVVLVTLAIMFRMENALNGVLQPAVEDVESYVPTVTPKKSVSPPPPPAEATPRRIVDGTPLIGAERKATVRSRKFSAIEVNAPKVGGVFYQRFDYEPLTSYEVIPDVVTADSKDTPGVFVRFEVSYNFTIAYDRENVARGAPTVEAKSIILFVRFEETENGRFALVVDRSRFHRGPSQIRLDYSSAHLDLVRTLFAEFQPSEMAAEPATSPAS